MLASWHADPREERPFAWLSLDAGDNDPVRFWAYVLVALRSVAPGLRPDVDSALRATGADLSELALPLLVNALADLDRELVLVLDDYHEIDNADVHRSVEFLIDHLPSAVQVALATRRDPPFGLARLRGRGALVELRTNDLRLSAAEALALLNESLGLELAAEQVERLRERTEGWAAGLQLAGLSLRGVADPARSIALFAGDHRQIVDYLASEVLARQSPEVRDFLVRTSILARLSGPLCDFVLQREGSAATLVELERANLFLVPLDESRDWYRYHHLFRDLLDRELTDAAPQDVAELHRRAWHWHEMAGLVPEAIHHAMAAGDHEQAAELIAANWLVFVNRGELETVAAWAGALPPDVAEADPRLCMARAWMLLVLGRAADVEREVRAALRGRLPGPMRDGSGSIESSAAMVRTSARLLLGDVGAAAETATLAAELEPDPMAPWRPIVTNALGMTQYWSGRPDEAAASFRETVAAGEVVGNHTASIYALGYLALISAERRVTSAAREVAERALAYAAMHQLEEHWVTVAAYYGVGRALRADGDHAGAMAAVEHGLNIATRSGLRLDTVHGLLELRRLAIEAGDPVRAEELYERAARQLSACPDPGALRERFERAAPSHVSGDRVRAGGDELSPRELAVLRLLPSSLSVREIGDELYVSFNTVKTHVRSVYAKLRVSTRAEAIARARELGLL